MKVKCADCEKVFDVSAITSLTMVQGLNERLDPGSEVPAGECPDPECGAFCYLVKGVSHDLKVFTTTDFMGHTPVGSAAVIVAENIVKADEVLLESLGEYLRRQNAGLEIELVELDTSKVGAIILFDGNY